MDNYVGILTIDSKMYSSYTHKSKNNPIFLIKNNLNLVF